MTLDQGLVALAQDLFARTGRITIRPMFSGGGIYCDGLMFGLIAEGAVYLKADQRSVPAFEAEGCRPFTYEGRTRTVSLGYWRMPDRLLDDPEEAEQWAREAIRVARAAAQSKAAKSGTRRKGAPRS